MIPTSDLDRLLLSFCRTHWLKVARIAADTYQALEGRGIQITVDTAKVFDARTAALVGSGQLEAKGDIRQWRFSEVRLPGERGKVAE